MKTEEGKRRKEKRVIVCKREEREEKSDIKNEKERECVCDKSCT